MEALGEYDFYSPDYRVFVQSVSRIFGVNIEVRFDYDPMKEELIAKENELFNFNYEQTYTLIVWYFQFDENKPALNNTCQSYELRIPIILFNEDELFFQFLPNGIFRLNFLPFNNLWRFFIEDILGKNDVYYKSHDEVVNQFIQIRNCYIGILSKFDCTRVLIWTEANYNTEGEYLFCQTLDRKNSLSEIVQFLKRLDNITTYNFVEALQQKLEIKSENAGYLDVAFIDNFNDKFDIT